MVQNLGQIVNFESRKYTSWKLIENSGMIRILGGFQIRPQTASNLCCIGGPKLGLWDPQVPICLLPLAFHPQVILVLDVGYWLAVVLASVGTFQPT